MEASRFDALTRCLTTAGSRRGALRTLAGSALAAVLSPLGVKDAAAACQKVGQSCAKNSDCCTGAYCPNKVCKCKRGYATCGKACCGLGLQCLKTEPPTCCSMAKVCGTQCCRRDRTCICLNPPPGIDPPPDPDALCKCVCKDHTEEDANGDCVCKQPCGKACCQPQFGEVCCGEGEAATCAHILTSHYNCGGCGIVCPADRICQNGECVCRPEYIDCGVVGQEPSFEFGECLPRTEYMDCSGECITWSTFHGNADQLCCTDEDCSGGKICDLYQCVCPFGYLECPGECIKPTGCYPCCSDEDCKWLENADDPYVFCCKNPDSCSTFPYGTLNSCSHWFNYEGRLYVTCAL